MPVKKYLAVIPARSGSKGIVDKNIRPINGTALIAYTLQAANVALEAGLLARCIVSTDSPRIAQVALDHGGEVPFLRPSALASDQSKSIDTILHALDTLGETYDAVVTLQPTSPLRTAQDLMEGIAMYDAREEDSLIAVYEDPKANGFNYYRMDDRQYGIAEHTEHNTGIRRQDMKPMYVRNGALYITSVALLTQRRLIIGDKPLLYVMPKERSVDLDSMADYEYLQWLMRRNTPIRDDEAKGD